MNRVFCIIGMLAVVGCSSSRLTQNHVARSAIDTEGLPLADSTALGDIDMAATTVGDLKAVVAPDYSSVSNAAMSASQVIPEIEDTLYNKTIGYGEATNIIWQAAIATQKYIYDNYTETLYKFSAENDFLLMEAVTNVPPTPDVIKALEEMK